MNAHTESRRLSWPALRALADVNGPHCGALSPLARLTPPAGTTADRNALLDALDGADPVPPGVLPALLDPGLTLAVIVAHPRRQGLAQYLWADPRGIGEGFALAAAADGLALVGPIAVDDVVTDLLDALALHQVAECEPARFRLDTAETWALLALVDALGTSQARLAEKRDWTPTPAVSPAEIGAAWDSALAPPQPGWAVGMAALIAEDGLPADFRAELPSALARLQDRGLLVVSGADSSLLCAGLELDLLARGTATDGLAFGLARCERRDAARIEVLSLVGFRLADGVALFDISALKQGHSELLLLGASQCADALESILGAPKAPSDAPRAVPSVADFDGLLIRLREPSAKPAAACPHCGQSVSVGARFCGSCGSALS